MFKVADMDNGKLVAVVAICVAACGSPAGVGAEPTDAVAGARADHGALTMRVARASHSAVALPDGRALLIGGCVRESCEAGPDSRTADVFDPRTQRFELAGTLQTPRVSTTAVDLPGGRLLLAGGWAGSSVTDSTEIFDWRSGRSIRGPNLSSARADMAAASLPDGRVILAGGYDGRGATDAIDLYDPSDRSPGRLGRTGLARQARHDRKL